MLDDLVSDIQETMQPAPETETVVENESDDQPAGIDELIKKPENDEKEVEDKDEKGGKEEEKEEPKEDDPRPSRGQRRIQRLRGELSNSNTKLRELQEENQRLKREYGLIDDKGLPIQPNPRNYRSREEYENAHMNWQRNYAREKNRIETEKEIAYDNMKTDFNRSHAEGRVKYPDYDKVINSAETPIHPHVEKVLIDKRIIDNPSDVAYALAKTPGAIEALNGMSDGQAMAQLVKISEVLKQKPKQAPKPKKQIKKVGDGDSKQVDSLMTDKGFDKFLKGS